MIISTLLGVLIGIILGMTGAGGGILAVPALVFALHWPMQKAAPVALIAVALSAGLGAVQGLRRGLVRYKAAGLMAVSGFPLTYLGQFVAHRLSQALLMVGFSCVMLLVAYRLYTQTKKSGFTDELDQYALARVYPDTGKFIWSISTALILSVIGAVTGFMTGLLGVGGGFLIVPLLRKYSQVSMQGVVATSLLVIALVGLGGVLSSLMRGAVLEWDVAAIFTFATMAGMVVGRSLVHRVSPRVLQIGFALVLTFVSLGLFVNALLSI